MTTKASGDSANRISIQSSIEDILGYELALHIFRMLKIEESAQETSINNIAELSEVLSERSENLSYVQSQAEALSVLSVVLAGFSTSLIGFSSA